MKKSIKKSSFPTDTPIMGLKASDIDRRCDLAEKCLDNIDAVFDFNRMIRDSSRA